MKYDRDYACERPCYFDTLELEDDVIILHYMNGDIEEERQIFAFGEENQHLLESLIGMAGTIVRRYWRVRPEHWAYEIQMVGFDPIYVDCGADGHAYVSYSL